MRICVIQRDDTRSVLTSSGTLFYMTKALETHVGEVTHLGPDRTIVSRLLILGAKLLNKMSVPLLKRRVSPIHQRLLSLHAARFFGSRIACADCDVLYAPFASVEMSRLTTSIPIVYHTDMTWESAVGYYSIYSSLFDSVKRTGEQIQSEAIQKAAAVILPTEWAAESVTGHYGKPSSTVFVLPYGANFAVKDIPGRDEALSQHLTSPVSLLWIGVDWERKGGPVAYECLIALLDSYPEATLTICGCVPPPSFQHPSVRVIPFLSKNNPAQRRQLQDLFLQATFFVFPTLGEAAAIVLCEASAHGLPSLVPRTGGLASVVRDGYNGYLFETNATGKQYAARIVSTLADPAGYRRLLETSRDEFEQRLNWDTWAKSAKQVFEQARQTEAQ